MSEKRRVLSFEELDGILPLIAELHFQNKEFMELFTKTGYYAWLLSMFPHLAIWAAYEGSVPIGYIMLGIQLKYGKKEALIYEAYCPYDTDIVEETWDEVIQWAKDNGCELISCYTSRDKAIARKYGFTCVRHYLTKEI